MNKMYILIGLLLTNPIQSSAVEQKSLPVVCDKTSVIIDSLSKRFKEITILAGTGLGVQENHVISVWGNPETKTFTILDTFGDTTCVLSVGNNVEILLQEAEPTGPKI